MGGCIHFPAENELAFTAIVSHPLFSEAGACAFSLEVTASFAERGFRPHKLPSQRTSLKFSTSGREALTSFNATDSNRAASTQRAPPLQAGLTAYNGNYIDQSYHVRRRSLPINEVSYALNPRL